MLDATCFSQASLQFVGLFCGFVENFSVGQKDLQNILRNALGRKLSFELRVNTVPPKDAILKVLCNRRRESIARMGTVNIKQYLRLLLSQCDIPKPMNSIH